jgi:uncharacterized protein (TIGR02145 family)
MYLTKSLLIGFCIVLLSNAQSISIKGVVKDSAGAGVAGAVVLLENAGLKDTTKADGSFALGDKPTGIAKKIDKIRTESPSVNISNSVLRINVAEKTSIRVDAYNLHGMKIFTLKNTITTGLTSISLPKQQDGLYLYKVNIGKSAIAFVRSSISGEFATNSAIAQRFSSTEALIKLSKTSATINDVIAITKTGYLNYRAPITTSDTTGVQVKIIASAGNVTDADGNVYQTVRIGRYIWTVENLRTTKYNDGTPIPMISDSATWHRNTTAAFCFYKNTTNQDSIKKFGALYNWYAVNNSKLAPLGWRVPTNNEWDSLPTYLIAHGYNWDGTTTGNKLAKSMAANTDWPKQSVQGYIGNDLTKNNKSGFSAKPAANRAAGPGSNYDFSLIGQYASWWSATSVSSFTAPIYYLDASSTGLMVVDAEDKSFGFSVRLVKN